MTAPVFSAVMVGTNADLIAEVARLYLHDGMIVADVTYGAGVFWRKLNRKRFTLIASDLHPRARTGAIAADFCALTHLADQAVDVVVLDPPYMHNPGRPLVDRRYANRRTTRGLYNRDIMDLYVRGMAGAQRVLKPGGQLWVKCKDEVESGRQCWSHIIIYENACKLGLYARDLFVLVPTSRVTGNRWSRQLHARKVHSYLWIFDHVARG